MVNLLKNLFALINKKIFRGHEGSRDSWGLPHGCGKYTDSNGDVYDGNYNHGWRSGKGKITYANGDVYDGLFKYGNLRGQGEMRYANGDVFNGVYKSTAKMEGHINGKFWFNGQGKMTYANGNVFEGSYEIGERNGQGKLTYANGDVYDGLFEFDDLNGRGKMTEDNGDVYEGKYRNGNRHGSWTLLRSNDHKYKLTYKNNVETENSKKQRKIKEAIYAVKTARVLIEIIGADTSSEISSMLYGDTALDDAKKILDKKSSSVLGQLTICWDYLSNKPAHQDVRRALGPIKPSSSAKPTSHARK